MKEILSIILLIIGAAFIFLSALGLIRMPDLYLRMSASTKSSTLGVGSILIAAAIHFFELGIASRAIAIVFFVLLTAPVSAHLIGRAAYFNGVPLWEKSRYNELKGRYNLKAHTLDGPEQVLPQSGTLSDEQQTSIS